MVIIQIKKSMYPKCSNIKRKTETMMAMTEMMNPEQRGRSLESCLSEISAATDKIMKPCLLINAFLSIVMVISLLIDTKPCISKGRESLKNQVCLGISSFAL